MDKVLFSSKSGDWETPWDFFQKLDEEFVFTLDVCADESNRKCHRYFSKQTDGLKQNWEGEVCWCNPPYGRGVEVWVAKAYETVINAWVPTTVVMLVPARTDTKWFHRYMYKKPNVEIRFVRGRLKFGGSKDAAPFPSMVVVFKSEV